MAFKVVEESDQRLVLRVGAAQMLGHLGLCIFIFAAISASLTMFLQVYIGYLAYLLVSLPGLTAVVCGFVGCANARQFTFTFDRGTGEFVAQAGRETLRKPLHEVVLVHIEKECNYGVGLGSDAPPGFAPALLFSNGCRFRLEGGVSVSGSGRGPEWLHTQADMIRQFLLLPQRSVPILNVSRASKDEEFDELEAHSRLFKWLSCQGLAPRLSPAVAQYDWVEPPEGPILLPSAGPVGGRGQNVGPYWQQPIGNAAAAAAIAAAMTPQYQMQHGATPLVVGRVHRPQQTRMLEVVVPEGTIGQTLTVRTPDGTQVQVTVPMTSVPGQTLTVQY